MSRQQVQITASGIKKALRRFRIDTAICEYIWNGFDASASVVELDYKTHDKELGGIKELRIRDNGTGIDHEKLHRTFMPFYQTYRELELAAKQKLSAVHGKNGIGRLTFFHFAKSARWDTTFVNGEGRAFSYSITIDQDSLHSFTPTEPAPTQVQSGTSVVFQGINSLLAHDIHTTIKSVIATNFAWFLELNRAKGFQILINGEPLDYKELIVNSDEKPLEVENNFGKHIFYVRFFLWSRKLGNEFSRYYFIDSENSEIHNRTTTLNNKGDSFFHSVYIKSEYFDSNVLMLPWSIDENDTQQSLFDRRDTVIKDLIQQVDRFLRDKRKPFLKRLADKVVRSYEEEGIFPEFGNNSWDFYRFRSLEDLVRELYQVQPTLFTKLNLEQKKTFVRLLNLVLDVDEREDLFKILEEVIELDSLERQELANVLRRSPLSNIIKTIRLLEERIRAIDDLQQIVFNKQLAAKEKHVQEMIENHYWLFGEEYHLAAADDDFEKALQAHSYILRGEKKAPSSSGAGNRQRMDLLIVRRVKQTNRIDNIVVEVKHPDVNLGEDELSQVKRYLREVKKEDQFNARNMTWTFILVGNGLDSTGFMKGEMADSLQHGEDSLVYNPVGQRTKIYVKTWSELLVDVRLRHDFVLKEFKTKRDTFDDNIESADAIAARQKNSLARRPPVPSIPPVE